MDKVPLSLVTLQFARREAEVDYIRAASEQSLPLVRVAIILGCSLYLLFGVLDLWIVPEAIATVWSIRGVVCALMLIALVVSYRPGLGTGVQGLGAGLVLVTGLGIVAMVATANPVHGTPYYAGLILVVIFSHGLLRLRFVVVTGLTGFVITAYTLVVLMWKPMPAVNLVNNLFFLISAQIVCMFVSYSLEYYGRKVFWQGQILEEQGQRLRVEDERKTRELEEIRALQFAMLPRKLPDLREYELAVHMQTTTEVGGDFYDIQLGEDGTLLCVIGDAVGHGARAGAIVTGMKMLLSCLQATEDLSQVLRQASATFKQCGIPGMVMSLALVRIRNQTAELAGAGMPPALLFRSESKRVEELSLEGMPVGAMANFPYRCSTLEMGVGDALLLMSDGFPEWTNRDGVQLGYPRTTQAFAAVAPRSCDEIITHLISSGEAWAGTNLPDDDVTFVVLKKAPHAQPI